MMGGKRIPNVTESHLLGDLVAIGYRVGRRVAAIGSRRVGCPDREKAQVNDQPAVRWQSGGSDRAFKFRHPLYPPLPNASPVSRRVPARSLHAARSLAAGYGAVERNRTPQSIAANRR